MWTTLAHVSAPLATATEIPKMCLCQASAKLIVNLITARARTRSAHEDVLHTMKCPMHSGTEMVITKQKRPRWVQSAEGHTRLVAHCPIPGCHYVDEVPDPERRDYVPLYLFQAVRAIR